MRRWPIARWGSMVVKGKLPLYSLSFSCFYRRADLGEGRGGEGRYEQ